MWKSSFRVAASQPAIHTIPTSPTTWNPSRQLNPCCTMIHHMNTGVRIEPTDVPLWSTPLPIALPRAVSRICVVLSAQGQWAASKKPSTVRNRSNSS